MERRITGMAAALTVLFGVALQAAAVTPVEALDLTVEDFDKIEQQEKGPAIFHVLTTLYNYYTANFQEEKAACMVRLYNTPLVEGSKTSVLMTDIGIGLREARNNGDPSKLKLPDVIMTVVDANCADASMGGE